MFKEGLKINIIFNIAVVYIICMIIFIIANIFKKIQIDQKKLYIIWGIFALALAIVAYCTEPSREDDLFRHYQEMERMRLGGIDYLKDPNQAVYKSYFIINYLFYGIALIGNNRLLPFIIVLITYSLIFYVSLQMVKKYKINYSILSIGIILLFAILPFRIVVSGLRNWLAFSIVFFAIYRDFIEEKKDVATFLMYILPIFIHSSVIIIIGIRILSIEKLKRYKLHYVVIFWSLLAGVISQILSNIPVMLLNDFGRRLSVYVNGKIFDKRIFIIQIIFLICIYLINRIAIKKNLTNEYNLSKYIDFIQYLIVFSLGAILVPELLRRMSYFLAYLLIPSIFLLFKIENKKFKYSIISIFSIMILGLLAHQVWDCILWWRFSFN